MSSELETSIEERTIVFAQALGWIHYKMQFRGQNGCPDSWFFKNGNVRIVEFKRPKKGPRPGQAIQIAKLLKAGMKVYVVSDVKSGIHVFEE